MPGGAWNGSWNGSPGIPVQPVLSVRFPVLSMQLMRPVDEAVVMVRRRSTVRFRNGAPGQSHNSNHHSVLVGTNGLPRWKISTVLDGDQDSRHTALPGNPAIQGAPIMYWGHQVTTSHLGHSLAI